MYDNCFPFFEVAFDSSLSLLSFQGAAFLTQTVALDDYTVKFEIWDTAGQERYRSLAPMYYRGAAAALVVYDITAADSFDGAKTWIEVRVILVVVRSVLLISCLLLLVSRSCRDKGALKL